MRGRRPEHNLEHDTAAGRIALWPAAAEDRGENSTLFYHFYAARLGTHPSLPSSPLPSHLSASLCHIVTILLAQASIYAVDGLSL